MSDEQEKLKLPDDFGRQHEIIPKKAVLEVVGGNEQEAHELVAVGLAQQLFRRGLITVHTVKHQDEEVYIAKILTGTDPREFDAKFYRNVLRHAHPCTNCGKCGEDGADE